MFDWWMKVFFKNYVNFSGRARRAEYWYFVLVNFIIYISIMIFMAFVEFLEVPYLQEIVGIALSLFCLAVFLPGLAVLVRRLHDTNRSGWYIFFLFCSVCRLYLSACMVIYRWKSISQSIWIRSKVRRDSGARIHREIKNGHSEYRTKGNG